MRILFFKLISFFVSFFSSLMAPFWVVYFYEIGLISKDVGMLIIFMYVGIFVFEIPTGAFADLIGRKFSVNIAYIFYGITFILIFFTTQKNYLFLIHFFLGFSATFHSGAFQAWFGESIGNNGSTTRHWGELEAFRHAGSLISYLVGTFLVSKGIFKVLWIIEGTGIILIGIAIAIFGKETIKIDKQDKYLRKYLTIIKEGGEYIILHKIMRLLILASFLSFIGSGIISLLWQPFFTYEIKMDKSLLGIIMCLISIPYIIGAKLSANICKVLKSEINTIGVATAFISLPLIFWIFSKNQFWATGLFIVYALFDAMLSPLFSVLINRYSKDKIRATLFSTYSMVTGISTVLAALIFGAKEIVGYINLTIIAVGFYGLTSLILFSKFKRL